MKPYLLLTGLLGLLFAGCPKSETLTQPQTLPSLSDPVATSRNIQENLNVVTARVLCDNNPHGLCTVVTTLRGRYFVSARHLFYKEGVYTARIITPDKTETLNIVGLEGDPLSDLIVGIFDEVPVKLGPLRDQFMEDLRDYVRVGGTFDIQVLKSPREFLPESASKLQMNSMFRLKRFASQYAECLDCWFGNGSSGGGFVSASGANDVFWVVAGEWPSHLTENVRPMSVHPGIKGFTVATGATWTQIETYRAKLVREAKK